jgi:hypothetical protein
LLLRPPPDGFPVLLGKLAGGVGVGEGVGLLEQFCVMIRILSIVCKSGSEAPHAQSSHHCLGTEYGTMENLEAQLPVPKRATDKTLNEILIVPFEQMTLRRPMQLFKGILGLTPNVPAPPDPEFLYRLITGQLSVNAGLRDQVGGQFKTLENLIRKRHASTDRSVNALTAKLGLKSEEELFELSHGNANGSLFPQLGNIFCFLEGIPLKVFSAITAKEVLCPCCNANMMEDKNVWWGGQAIRLKSAEYGFVERLLNTVVGSYIGIQFLSGNEKFQSWEWISSMANPERHPIGNWLAEVRTHYDCDNLLKLETRFQLRGHEGDEITHRRLKDWSSGQDLMPMKAVSTLISGLSDEDSLKIQHLVARTFALAVDFICSAAEVDDKRNRKVAQGMVYQRLCALREKILLQLHNLAGNNLHKPN